MIRAVIYARISQDRSGEGLGVARQLKECHELADARGWSVVDSFVDDDISAYTGKHRPEYARMLEAIEAGAVDAVVVWDLDRLTRRPLELEQFTALCLRSGPIELATTNERVDLADGNGLLFARIKAAVAAAESDQKARRAKSKMRELAEAGKPSGGGPRPFGMRPDRITWDEVEGDLIKQMAARLLAGESLGSVARWADASGVPTVSGVPWRPHTIRDLIKQPRLAGLRQHQGQVIGQAAWPALISEDDHRALVTLFSDPSRRTNRTARRYLLSGLVRCGKCGATMVSNPRPNGTRRYICRSGPDFRGCGGMQITAQPVDELVAQSVLLRLDSPELAQSLAGSIASDEAARTLNESISADEAKREELAKLYAENAIDARSWVVALKPIEDRIKANRRRLSSQMKERQLAQLVGTGHALSESWMDLPLSRQTAIVKAVLSHVTIHSAKKMGLHHVDLTRVEPTWRL